MVHSQRNAMARKLFRRSPVTIGEAIRKVEDLLRRDKSLEQSIKRMRENTVFPLPDAKPPGSTDQNKSSSNYCRDSKSRGKSLGKLPMFLGIAYKHVQSTQP